MVSLYKHLPLNNVLEKGAAIRKLTCCLYQRRHGFEPSKTAAVKHHDTMVLAWFADGSSQQYIADIRTPTLWLVSRDDPFVSLVPVEECRANPSVALVETSRGGHVAHLQGWPSAYPTPDLSKPQAGDALTALKDDCQALCLCSCVKHGHCASACKRPLFRADPISGQKASRNASLQEFGHSGSPGWTRWWRTFWRASWSATATATEHSCAAL